MLTGARVSGTSNINHVIFGIHSAIREPERDDDLWTDEQKYTMIADSELGLTINPFPLNPEDIIDVGGRVVPDFEEHVDCDNHVMKDHESGFSHNISVVFTRLSSQ